MNRPILLRPSERGDFEKCQFLWFQRWVKQLTTPEVPTWSWFGTAIHAGLAARYPVGIRRGTLTQMYDAFEECVDGEKRRVWTEGSEIDEEEVVDGVELGRAMLKGYVEHWGRDSDWEVVHNEQTFQIDVPDYRDPNIIVATLCLTLDLAVWNRARKCFEVVDHKTRRGFPSTPDGWKFFDLNTQGGSYLWVIPELLRHLGIMKRGDYVDGIIFNCLKKKTPDDRLRDPQGRALNKNGTISKVQPAPLFYRHHSRRTPQERVRQARHVANEATVMRMVRNGTLPVIKSPTEDCPRCQMYDLCLLDEKDPQDAEYYAASMLVRRDPYASHREKMAEGGIEIPRRRVGKGRRALSGADKHR